MPYISYCAHGVRSMGCQMEMHSNDSNAAHHSYSVNTDNTRLIISHIPWLLIV